MKLFSVGKYWCSKTQVFNKCVPTNLICGGEGTAAFQENSGLKWIFNRVLILFWNLLWIYFKATTFMHKYTPSTFTWFVCLCLRTLFRTKIFGKFFLIKMQSRRVNLSEFPKLSARKWKFFLCSDFFWHFSWWTFQILPLQKSVILFCPALIPAFLCSPRSVFPQWLLLAGLDTKTKPKPGMNWAEMLLGLF